MPRHGEASGFAARPSRVDRVWECGRVLCRWHGNLGLQRARGGVAQPFPAASDVFFLLLPLLMLVGLLWSSGTASRSLGLKQAADLGLTVCVVAMVTSLMLYRELVALDQSFLYTLTVILWAAAHMVALIFAVFILLRHALRLRRVVGLQVISLFALAIVANLYAHSLASESYRTGHGIDVGWIIGFVFLTWASFEADWYDGSRTEPE